MEKKRLVAHWLLVSVLAIAISGVLWHFIFVKVATSVAYTTNVGRYVFPFGIAHWWDGIIFGVVWSAVLAFVIIRKKKCFIDFSLDNCRVDASIITAVTYMITIFLFAIPALFLTTSISNWWWYPVAVFFCLCHCFASVLFYCALFLPALFITYGAVYFMAKSLVSSYNLEEPEIQGLPGAYVGSKSKGYNKH